MPITRMLDYGMGHWDAVRLFHSPISEPWDEIAAGLADAQIERGEAAASRGDVETAVACYRRGAAALNFAHLMYNTDTPQKIALYERSTTAYEAAATLDTALRVKRLSVPFASSACNAWFVGPPTITGAPTVIIVGGQSGWGPAFHKQAEGLVRRGLSAVLLEVPGQGLSRMHGALFLNENVDGAFTCALDAARELTAYEGAAGVWGNSLGGLFAARAAVHDPRFAAVCVNGAPPRPEVMKYRSAREQALALFGTDSDREVNSAYRRLWLDASRDRTDAAVLLLHGGADVLVTLEQQQEFLNLSDRGMMRVWDDGEHTLYNHAAERNEVVGDWFRAELGPARGERTSRA